MKIRRFLKTAFIFLTGNMLSKLISFFLLPLYTSRIAPGQMGIYDLAMSFINLIAPIAFLQIWDGMFRFAFDYKADAEKKTVVSNTLLVFLFGIAIYFCAFCALNAVYDFDYFGYILLYGLVYALHYVHTYVARVFLKNKLFVFSGLANTLCTALLNIFLIVGLGWDVKSIYVAATVGALLQMAIIEWKVGVIRHFSLKNVDKKLIFGMIRFSAPLCVATISYWLLSGFTKVVITENLGAAENGLYAVANRFASIITLVVSVVQFAWNEAAYLMADDKDRTKSYQLCVDLMMKAVCFGTAILCLVIKLIFPWFVAEQYSEAVWIIPAAIIGVGANALAGFYGTLFMTEKKTGFILISTLIAAGVNVVFTSMAANRFGLMGAVSVLAVSFALLMILRLIKLCRQYGISVHPWSAVLLVAALCVSVAAYYFIESAIGLILVCLLLAAVFLISIRSYIKIFLKSLAGKKGDDNEDQAIVR